MSQQPLECSASADLCLEEVLGLPQAKPLFDALVACRGSDLTLDASQVQHLGAQCAQVLVSGCKTWASDGHAFVFTAPSEAFVDGARLLGLTTYFERSSR